jgi:molecular chaperone DnaK
LVDKKNSTEGFILDIEDKMQRFGSQLAESDRTKLETAMAELKEAIKGNDGSLIDLKMNDALQAFGPLAEKEAEANKAEAKTEEQTDKDPGQPVDVEAKEVKPGN